MGLLGTYTSATSAVVLVCQGCPYVWEPGAVSSDDFAALVRDGCPDCGGWVWLGELAGPAEQAGCDR